MKKILITISILLISLFSFFSNIIPESLAACTYKDGEYVGKALDNCLKNSQLVNGKSVKVEAGGGFQKQVLQWTGNIALYLGVFAVGAIVFGSLILVLSAGEEEKIKKGKDIVKWGMLGFLGIIFASAIISLIVRIMYSI